MKKKKKEVKPGSERDVQRRIITWLRKERGWFVINTSGSWRATRGMAGVADLICHFQNMTVYLEIKGFDSTDLRPTQEKFLERLVPHMGPHLHFNIVNNENFKRIQWFMKEVERDSTL